MKKNLAFFGAIAVISFLPGCASTSEATAEQKTSSNLVVKDNSSSAQKTGRTGADGKIITNGWADAGKLSYADDKNKIIIDDAAYPDPIKKRQAFTKAISNSRPAFIIVSGDIDLSDGKISDNDHSYYDAFDEATGKRLHEDITYNIASNKTIIGTNNARLKFGGLVMRDGVKNVIIRNITFWDAHGSTEYNTKISKYKDKKASEDALVIEYNEKNGLITQNVWVDHCTFTDGTCKDLVRNYNHDGQFDIKAGKNITVSYCEFTNHDKVMLIAPSDKFTKAEDRQITLHHNYFHGVIQRLPRSRGCQMHFYNNFYDNIGVSENSGSVFGPGIASLYIIENNYIGKTAGSVLKYYDKSEKGSATFSKIYQSGNSKQITASNTSFDGVDKIKSLAAHLSETPVFEIPYDYSLEDVETLKDSIPAQAGANKVKITINGIEY